MAKYDSPDLTFITGTAESRQAPQRSAIVAHLEFTGRAQSSQPGQNKNKPAPGARE
jgi:hypothetical protein